MMKRFFGRRVDRDTPPTTEESPPAVLPPLKFVRPTPLESTHFPPPPPKRINSHVAAPPMQRYRGKQKSMGGGWDNKPLSNPARTPTQKASRRRFIHAPEEPSKPKASTTEIDDLLRRLPSPPNIAIPELRRDKAYTTIPDAPPTLSKSKALTPPFLLPHTPISSYPNRKPSTKPVPASEPLSSRLLALQKPLDPPQLRGKYYMPLDLETADTSYTTTSLSEIGTHLVHLRQSCTDR